MSFAYPYALLLLFLLPVIVWAARLARRPELAPLPGVRTLPPFGTSLRVALRWLPMALRVLALGLIMLAVARPQASTGWTTTSTEGLAIQIVYDRSGSMGEPIEEGGPSRNEVARQALIDFVKGDGKGLRGRVGDMIGLIAFARYADTISPLARVHEPLIDAAKLLKPVETRAEDGTAIGDALALAAARLKRAEEEISREESGPNAKPDFEIKSKVIVLMTDGQNNAGEVSPYEAAKLAKEWGIRIYTIGVGAGDRFVTVDTPFGRRQMSRGSEVDERMLREISSQTGGAYFAAGDPKALEDAYGAIDRLEKSRIDTKEHSRKIEWFSPLATTALAILTLELLAANTVFRRVG